MGELGSLCLCKVKVRATCPSCKEAVTAPKGVPLAAGCGETLVLPRGMATHTMFRDTVAFCGQS